MEQYEKLLALGQGGSADVFLARDTRTRALVAVKRVRVVPGKRLRDREAVLREAAILRRLRHPHVVACLGHFFDAGEQHLFIVQEYCEGGSLDRHIRARRGAHFSEGTVMRFFVQLALAVQHIHVRRILHRDIKPSNVFLTQAGRLKLGDFGIAKVLESSASLARTFVGTPYYLSPELCADVPYSAKADIWALGCLLFELCALRPPFQALSLMGLFKKIVEGAQAPLPGCYSEALQRLVRSILQKDPAARPSACSLLATPYIQEHLRLFRPQLQPAGPWAGWDGGRRRLSPPGPPPESPAARALALPLCAPPPQARQPSDSDEEGLSTSGSGSHYSADSEETSTTSSGSSSAGDPPSTSEATTAELTEYPADSDDSEGGRRRPPFPPASILLGGPQKHRQEAGPCWARKDEDGPCGSDGDSGTTELVLVALVAAAQACQEQSSSTEDSESWDTCDLLWLLDLDSP